MKKIVVILISFIFGISGGFALCNNSTLAKAKKEVSNINYSIDYHQIGDNVYYDIYINNITENMYFVDVLKDKVYYYSDTNNGEFILKNYNLNQISLNFYGTGECLGKKLINKSMKLPIYNSYYKNELCNDLEHLNVCKKWVNNFVGYDKFIETINQYNYKEKNKDIDNNQSVEVEHTFFNDIINFYIKYYYLVLGFTIIVCISIIIIHNKKNNFKL